MDSLSAFEGAGWGHVSHSLYATVRSGPGPSTPTSLFLKTCRKTIQAGPARERVALATRQDSRGLLCSGFRRSVSETRGNGGAFRDRSSHPWPLLVWPSLAKQLPPGTTIAPLTWQRHRHGSEHRLDLSTKCGLWRRISQGAPGSGGPVQDRVWPGMAKRRAYRYRLAHQLVRATLISEMVWAGIP